MTAIRCTWIDWEAPVAAMALTSKVYVAPNCKGVMFACVPRVVSKSAPLTKTL